MKKISVIRTFGRGREDSEGRERISRRHGRLKSEPEMKKK
jgi:hypothetical protein